MITYVGCACARNKKITADLVRAPLRYRDVSAGCRMLRSPRFSAQTFPFRDLRRQARMVEPVPVDELELGVSQSLTSMFYSSA